MLNPIAHKGACSVAVTPPPPGLWTSLLLMRLLHGTRLPPAGLAASPSLSNPRGHIVVPAGCSDRLPADAFTALPDELLPDRSRFPALLAVHAEDW